MATSTRHLLTSRRAQFLVLALIAAVVVISAGQLESAVLSISQSYADWLTRWTGQNAWAVFGLPALAFGGGLIASVSPCVLALLPVQLSYLGAQAATPEPCQGDPVQPWRGDGLQHSWLVHILGRSTDH